MIALKTIHALGKFEDSCQRPYLAIIYIGMYKHFFFVCGSEAPAIAGVLHFLIQGTVKLSMNLNQMNF